MSTGVGCHALLQRVFLTQGLKPHLLGLLQPGSLPPGKPFQPLAYGQRDFSGGQGGLGARELVSKGAFASWALALPLGAPLWA